MAGFIEISPEDLHKYVNDETLFSVDYDQVAFQSASAVQETKVEIVHKTSGAKKVFKNKSEFFGRGKAIGGWLGEQNIQREQNNKPPFSKDDFEVKDIVIPPKEISHTLQVVKQNLNKIVNHTQIKHYDGYVGTSETFRHALELPLRYKSKNRDIKPAHLEDAKKYLIKDHSGKLVTELEADDALTIWQNTGFNSYEKTGKFSHIVGSIDKDSNSTPGLIFNFMKKEGNFVYPNFRLIDKGIGDIWVEQKSKSKDIKGYGSYWLAYQLLVGDDTDTVRPYQDFDIRFGDMACFNIISECKTQKDLFSAVKDVYKDWFPDGVQFESWTGKNIEITSDEWLEQIFSLVYMKRKDNDQTTFSKMLKFYGG